MRRSDLSLIGDGQDLVQLTFLTAILFFASGFAALLYQIAWQRALFGWYGVDIDAISIIVSVFMLGLGSGAILGGWLADKFHRRRILTFSLIEMTIGLFGLFSLEIIDYTGTLFAATSLPRLTTISFLLFIAPTCAMGSTLPVLVTELTDRTHNVGLSTGILYFINTLGAAIGAFAAGLVLLSLHGLEELVAIGAMLNFAISAIAFIAIQRGL
jgi:MFS family permease